MGKTLFLVVLGVAALSMTLAYDPANVGAFHFHTYFFEDNPRHLKEALDFRKATRAEIKAGTLKACSINELVPGIDGPHPFGQYEVCCNTTSMPQAMSWFMKNHGNLSVLIHPLTVNDLEDHLSRTTWIGHPVPLDAECPCLYPELPKPRPCPIYPEYPDELTPGMKGRQFPAIAGTEDYSRNC